MRSVEELAKTTGQKMIPTSGPENTTISTIFLTQDNDAEIRRAALGTGAEGYVLKLAAARELVSTIEAALGLTPQPEFPYRVISRSTSQ